MDSDIIAFLKKCEFKLESENELEGQIIPRDMLLSQLVYSEVKHHISYLKKKFSSSALTSLQNGAEKDQRWPLLNIVRQLLKQYNYHLKPIRKSDGYDLTGRKLYKRMFLIEQIKMK